MDSVYAKTLAMALFILFRAKHLVLYWTKQLYHFLLHDLRACCHCGPLWGQVWLLCDRCEAGLGDPMKPHKFLDFGGFRVFAPLTWRFEDDLIRSVIYGQKGGLDDQATNKLASIILTARLSLGNFPSDAILVPVPSSQKGRVKKDHALSLAHGIARQTGWPVHPILFGPEAQSEQKSKGRDERQDLKIFSF